MTTPRSDAKDTPASPQKTVIDKLEYKLTVPVNPPVHFTHVLAALIEYEEQKTTITSLEKFGGVLCDETKSCNTLFHNYLAKENITATPLAYLLGFNELGRVFPRAVELLLQHPDLAYKTVCSNNLFKHLVAKPTETNRNLMRKLISYGFKVNLHTENISDCLKSFSRPGFFFDEGCTREDALKALDIMLTAVNEIDFTLTGNDGRTPLVQALYISNAENEQVNGFVTRIIAAIKMQAIKNIVQEDIQDKDRLFAHLRDMSGDKEDEKYDDAVVQLMSIMDELTPWMPLHPMVKGLEEKAENFALRDAVIQKDNHLVFKLLTVPKVKLDEEKNQTALKAAIDQNNFYLVCQLIDILEYNNKTKIFKNIINKNNDELYGLVFALLKFVRIDIHQLGRALEQTHNKLPKIHFLIFRFIRLWSSVLVNRFRIENSTSLQNAKPLCMEYYQRFLEEDCSIPVLSEFHSRFLMKWGLCVMIHCETTEPSVLLKMTSLTEQDLRSYSEYANSKKYFECAIQAIKVIEQRNKGKLTLEDLTLLARYYFCFGNTEEIDNPLLARLLQFINEVSTWTRCEFQENFVSPNEYDVTLDSVTDLLDHADFEKKANPKTDQRLRDLSGLLLKALVESPDLKQEKLFFIHQIMRRLLETIKNPSPNDVRGLAVCQIACACCQIKKAHPDPESAMPFFEESIDNFLETIRIDSQRLAEDCKHLGQSLNAVTSWYTEDNEHPSYEASIQICHKVIIGLHAKLQTNLMPDDRKAIRQILEMASQKQIIYCTEQIRPDKQKTPNVPESKKTDLHKTAENHYYLAVATLAIENYADAKTYFERAYQFFCETESTPGVVVLLSRCRYNLAYIFFKMSEMENGVQDACQMLNTAANFLTSHPHKKVDTQIPARLQLLLAIYENYFLLKPSDKENLKRLSDALRLCESSCLKYPELRPIYIAVNMRLGDYHSKENKREEASNFYHAAMRQNPSVVLFEEKQDVLLKQPPMDVFNLLQAYRGYVTAQPMEYKQQYMQSLRSCLLTQCTKNNFDKQLLSQELKLWDKTVNTKEIKAQTELLEMAKKINAAKLLAAKEKKKPSNTQPAPAKKVTNCVAIEASKDKKDEVSLKAARKKNKKRKKQLEKNSSILETTNPSTEPVKKSEDHKTQPISENTKEVKLEFQRTEEQALPLIKKETKHKAVEDKKDQPPSRAAQKVRQQRHAKKERQRERKFAEEKQKADKKLHKIEKKQRLAAIKNEMKEAVNQVVFHADRMDDHLRVQTKLDYLESKNIDEDTFLSNSCLYSESKVPKGMTCDEVTIERPIPRQYAQRQAGWTKLAREYWPIQSDTFSIFYPNNPGDKSQCAMLVSKYLKDTDVELIFCFEREIVKHEFSTKVQTDAKTDLCKLTFRQENIISRYSNAELDLSGSFISLQQVWDLIYLLTQNKAIHKLKLNHCKFISYEAVMEFQRLMGANQTITHLEVRGTAQLLESKESPSQTPLLMMLQNNNRITKLFLGNESAVLDCSYHLFDVLNNRQTKLEELSITNLFCRIEAVKPMQAYLESNPQMRVTFHRMKLKCQSVNAERCAKALNNALKMTVKKENITELCFGPDISSTHPNNWIFVMHATFGLKTDIPSDEIPQDTIIWPAVSRSEGQYHPMFTGTRPAILQFCMFNTSRQPIANLVPGKDPEFLTDALKSSEAKADSKASDNGITTPFSIPQLQVKR